MDWSKCLDAESVPDRLSGAWVVKGTRIPVQAILDNADDYSPEEIASEIHDGLKPEQARRIIAFARRHAPLPA